MRYYSIVIGAETAGPLGNPSSAPSGNAGATFTNQIGGKYARGAPLVELDIPIAGYAEPAGQATAIIWGVSLAQISQGADFQGAPVTISGGMQAGLPLATAAAATQQGVLVSGIVLQSYGNWMGVNQSLGLTISTDGGVTQDVGCNLHFTWPKGQLLADMIKQTLAIAYPSLTPNINISPSLVLPADEPGVYYTIQQFARYVKNVSQDIVNGSNPNAFYPGVDIVIKDKTINIFDGSTQTTPKQINFQDLIGQPTWIDAYDIQFNTVMRADISIGDTIQLPSQLQFLSLTGANSQSQARSQTAFQGTWTVNFIRHVGNSRAPDAQSWITTFRAYSNQAPPATTNPVGGTGS
jgi:hypothetical protein